MKRLLVFCSNPTDGGTAEMFVQCCLALSNNRAFDMEVIPCVDKLNTVKVFEMLSNLVRLDVLSEVQVCGSHTTDKTMFQRIINRFKRYKKYASVRHRNMKIMKEYIEANRIDSVLIHNGGYFGDDLCNQMLEAAYDAGLNGKRVIVFHGTHEKKIMDKIRFFLYDRMVNRCASDIITGSDYSRRFLSRETGLKKIQVVPNGISYADTMTDEEKKRKINYRNADIHIVNVANFYEMKGQMCLLRAFDMLTNKISRDVTLTLIGHPSDKEYYSACLKFIDDHKLNDKVTIADNIFNSREYMNLFDITVVSSLGGEDLPMVPLEAMRSGVPTIAFACNGIPEEIQNGSNGILVDVGNVEELAEAMRLVVEDDGLRVRLGGKAKEDYNERFTGEKMGNRYIKVLESK